MTTWPTWPGRSSGTDLSLRRCWPAVWTCWAFRCPRSWAELGQATRAAGLSNGTGWSKSQGDYAQLARAALAMLADALDEPLALRLHRWLASAGAPFVAAQDYRRDPLFNIVPRADAPPRCA